MADITPASADGLEKKKKSKKLASDFAKELGEMDQEQLDEEAAELDADIGDDPFAQDGAVDGEDGEEDGTGAWVKEGREATYPEVSQLRRNGFVLALHPMRAREIFSSPLLIHSRTLAFTAPLLSTCPLKPLISSLTSQLLRRFFSLLHQHNPELAGEKRKYTIVPPQVAREGTKKTMFSNITDICRRMHRQPEHMIQFLYSELGTQGSVDGNQRLIMKGRYTQKQIENVLRKYIGELKYLALIQ